MPQEYWLYIQKSLIFSSKAGVEPAQNKESLQSQGWLLQKAKSQLDATSKEGKNHNLHRNHPLIHLQR